MTPAEEFLAMSPEERKKLRDEFPDWRREDHIPELRLVASILRRHDERQAGVA